MAIVFTSHRARLCLLNYYVTDKAHIAETTTCQNPRDFVGVVLYHASRAVPSGQRREESNSIVESRIYFQSWQMPLMVGCMKLYACSLRDYAFRLISAYIECMTCLANVIVTHRVGTTHTVFIHLCMYTYIHTLLEARLRLRSVAVH